MANHIESDAPSPYRILSLDGGGAKGFYTIGVLKQIEALLGGGPLCNRFDLIFGTSTGSIIAALLALGYSVDEVHEFYRKHVPTVMKKWTCWGRTAALNKLATEVFGNLKFDQIRTGIGIVATRWLEERPMIFKADIAQAHGSQGTFQPGFGCTIADAVVASCSAYPYFNRKIITKGDGSTVELLDGGYCANNPTLYAVADAVKALNRRPEELRLVSIGVGEYPPPPRYLHKWLIWRFFLVRLLQKTLDINTRSMEQLAKILFRDVPMVRISDAFTSPDMATDLMEHNLKKLNSLYQRGEQSYAAHEQKLRELLS